MRILTNTEQPVIPASVSAPAATPTVSPVDMQRTSALERLVDALRGKIRDLEDRLHMLEQVPKVLPVPVAAPAPAPTRPTVVPVSIDPEAFKKNLLNKMWKYLQDDERPAKTI